MLTRSPSRDRRRAILLLAGYVMSAPARAGMHARAPEAFSATAPGAIPAGWRHVRIAFWKRPTEYAPIADGASMVIRARAESAASSLIHDLDVDPARMPVVTWRWKVVVPVRGADNRRRDAEDASARLMLEFDGAGESSGERNAAGFLGRLAEADSAHGVLMYITSDEAPAEAIIENPRTAHIRMLVVGPASATAGRWMQYTRNYRADYARAFGRAPGRLTAVGIMTDSDNTASLGEALYGDIELSSPSPALVPMTPRAP